MKEKKFKIYNKTIKKLMKEPSISLSINNKGVVTILQDNNSVVCEFTGLYDKNGTEIFEKDIIATYGKDMSGKHTLIIKDEVEHLIKVEKGISKFKIKKIRKGISNLKLPFLENAVIIGNSIENPELLD